MRLETRDITVPGQLSSPAKLTGYIIDPVSAAPGRLRPAIVICPGGGYSMCSDKESEPVALQFLAMGYHAFLLHYSVAPNHFPTALLELAEAVAGIRDHAEEWKVDSDKILVCGFSAGGHLACSLGVFWNREMVQLPVNRTAEQIKPNGLILCYPVITAGRHAHEGSFENLMGSEAVLRQEQRDLLSLDMQVGAHTPKTFLWHTFTDQSVPVENSLQLAAALRKQGVNFELHIYPSGVHGLSLANAETGGSDERHLEPCCESWIPLLKMWLGNF